MVKLLLGLDLGYCFSRNEEYNLLRERLHELYCLYSSDIELSSKREGTLMLIESGIHLISCNPGCIWRNEEADLEFLCSEVQA